MIMFFCVSTWILTACSQRSVESGAKGAAVGSVVGAVGGLVTGLVFGGNAARRLPGSRMAVVPKKLDNVLS